MKIHRLDLGGTACYEDRDAISISLDGSTSGDEVVRNIVGDYQTNPFAAESFDEAFGSCFLEGDARETKRAYKDVFRVLRHGAVLTVKSCGKPYKYHLQAALAAGFEIKQTGYVYFEEDGSLTYDAPWIFVKP